MATPVIRIHPAIGFARVGNSSDYYLAPDSSAGLNQPGTAITGGLPIQPGTESTPVSDADLRDAAGALKRQAQRFRLYLYADAQAAKQYPYTGTVTEVVIGSTVDGRTVSDIVWTVHLANKKSNCWTLVESTAPGKFSSLSAYDDGQLPPLRNLKFAGSSDPADPKRLTALVVDAGPRVIRGASAKRINFDKSSAPAYYTGGKVQPLPNYPTSYPSDHFSKLYNPSGVVVGQLGAIETDAQGRLVVIGGEGTASAWYQDENGDSRSHGGPFPLNDDVNNDGWFDDTADGPVNATLVFSDGSQLAIANTAWAVSTDPSYAPQIRNVVSLWDEVYDTWTRNFGLDPSLYSGPPDPGNASGFNKAFKPSFSDDIFPIFRSAHLQMFTTGLNALAIGSHARLDNLSATSNPASFLNVQSFIRSPYPGDDEFQVGSPRMPLALGDTGAAFLTLTQTQYFFLNQWFANAYTATPDKPLTAGELLDRNALTNCLGGRFSPGIDLTFIVRDPVFYNANWQDPDNGPFRLNAAALDYSKASKDKPFLGVGYIPERANSRVEPGDLCKFMALPWHTDYNSCATHLPSPNPGGSITNTRQTGDGRNTTLFWSWPAQRPVSVYSWPDLKANGGKLPTQRYSVRGEGTRASAHADGAVYPAQNVGRFQIREDMVKQWQDIGVVIQGAAIQGYTFDQNYYLEVQSRMSDVSDVVVPWPNQVTDKLTPTG
jgi:hypothetical protein